MSATFDATTTAEYAAATTAAARSALIVAALTGTISVKVFNGSNTEMGSGTMAAPWATAADGTVTVGEVTSFTVGTTGTPDADWYIRFQNAGATRWVRGSFGLSSSSQDFTWSLSTWTATHTGTIGTATIITAGNAAPVFSIAPTNASIASTGGTIQFIAVDPDGDSVVYSLTTTRSGITINSSTGLVTVTSAAAATSGNIVVQASDGTLTTSATCAVTVASSADLLVEDFSTSTWYTKWSNPSNVYAGTGNFYTSTPARCTRVTPAYTGEGYEPNPDGSGYALKIQVTSGSNSGTDLSFFPRLTSYGTNPTELFLEYWIRFGSTWNAVINGKMPGLSGDFNDGGKGNSWDAAGMNGWSARSGYSNPCGNPSQVGMSTYFYYVECGDRAGTAYEYSTAADPGQGKSWDNMTCGGSAVITKNTWRKVKIYAQRNTGSGAAAQRNGKLKVWVDDVVRLDFTQIMYTRNPLYQFVERAWMNVYHGGTAVATSDLHVFIADVRVWVP